jgi:hypothetical protein
LENLKQLYHSLILADFNFILFSSADGPPAKMSATQKREVSLLDSDYWQSLQQHNGKSPSIQVPKTQGKKEFENSAKLCRRKKSVG